MVGFFLSEMTILELRPTTALKRPSAAVAVVELVLISLSLILDWYRFNGLNRSGILPEPLTSYIRTSLWCASVLGTRRNVACTPHWNDRIASTTCTEPPAGTLFPLPSEKVR
jgi:hypothetical protein